MLVARSLRGRGLRVQEPDSPKGEAGQRQRKTGLHDAAGAPGQAAEPATASAASAAATSPRRNRPASPLFPPSTSE